MVISALNRMFSHIVCVHLGKLFLLIFCCDCTELCKTKVKLIIMKNYKLLLNKNKNHENRMYCDNFFHYKAVFKIVI